MANLPVNGEEEGDMLYWRREGEDWEVPDDEPEGMLQDETLAEYLE
jgi:hypothetical protein